MTVHSDWSCPKCGEDDETLMASNGAKYCKPCNCANAKESDALKGEAARILFGPGKGLQPHQTAWRAASQEDREAAFVEARRRRDAGGMDAAVRVLKAFAEKQDDKFWHPDLERIRAERKANYQAADERDSLPRDGFTYSMSHPAFPGWYKIGEGRDPEERRKTGNTFYPDRGLVIDGAVKTPQRRMLEQACHRVAKLRGHQRGMGDATGTGEWFYFGLYKAAIDLIRQVQNVNADI